MGRQRAALRLVQIFQIHLPVHAVLGKPRLRLGTEQRSDLSSIKHVHGAKSASANLAQQLLHWEEMAFPMGSKAW